MIIRGGENIYPREIEEFIYTHPKVRETLTEQEMKAFVLSHMAKHKVPRYVEFVESFPMNAAGKILKYKMREEAVERLGLKR